MAKIMIGLLAALLVLNALTFLVVISGTQESGGSAPEVSKAAREASDQRAQQIANIEIAVRNLKTSLDNLSRKLDDLPKKTANLIPRPTAPAYVPPAPTTPPVSAPPQPPAGRTESRAEESVPSEVPEGAAGTEEAAPVPAEPE